MNVDTVEKPLDLARRSFDTINKKALGSADFWCEESVYNFVGTGVFRGEEEIRGNFETMLSALPDLRLEIERTVVEGPVVVVDWNGYGTFQGGPLFGIAATGRRVTLRGVDVMETRGSKIITNTVHLDAMSFARQVGMLPPDGSAADRALKSGFNTLGKVRGLFRRG